MGKIIEFKKFSKNINKDNLEKDNFNLNIFPEDDLAYIRKELRINLNEISELLDCIYKQILINDGLINRSENGCDFNKLIYLKDYNDKLHDVIYFLTNSVYQEPIIIKLNFLELKYLLGTLQLQMDILAESQSNSKNNTIPEYLNVIETLYCRLSPIYNSWQEEIHKDK